MDSSQPPAAPRSPTSLTLKVVENIASVGEAAWDSLWTPLDTPFLRYAWLEALEFTRCVHPDVGWMANHFTLWDGDTLVGAAPAYLKSSSEGEFVFDHGWAQAARQLNIRYYPKLIVAVPFTPATGSRLLIHPDYPRETIADALAHGIRNAWQKLKISSAHILFPRAQELPSFERNGYATRIGVQFHWTNRGYKTYDDFLASFNSKRRHQLKRERREVEQSGIVTRTRRGAEITDGVLQAMFEFYLASVKKYYPWTQQYLNRPFFERVVERMPDAMEIVLAEDQGRPIAGALNVASDRRLYGRYWGLTEQRPFLHFHVCYYHSIEQCIQQGLEVFEPGAGGGHKLPRGFEPTATWSSHLIAHQRLDAAVRDFLHRETAAIQKVLSGEEEIE